MGYFKGPLAHPAIEREKERRNGGPKEKKKGERGGGGQQRRKRKEKGERKVKRKRKGKGERELKKKKGGSGRELEKEGGRGTKEEKKGRREGNLKSRLYETVHPSLHSLTFVFRSPFSIHYISCLEVSSSLPNCNCWNIR